jgi:hypothetical protein
VDEYLDGALAKVGLGFFYVLAQPRILKNQKFKKKKKTERKKGE